MYLLRPTKYNTQAILYHDVPTEGDAQTDNIEVNILAGSRHEESTHSNVAYLHQAAEESADDAPPPYTGNLAHLHSDKSTPSDYHNDPAAPDNVAPNAHDEMQPLFHSP